MKVDLEWLWPREAAAKGGSERPVWGRWSSVGDEPRRAGSTTRRERGEVQFDVHRRDLPRDETVGGPVGAVLTVLGDLDMAGAPGLHQAVVADVMAGSRLVVLDLTAVDFVDSAGLGVVVGALRRLRAHDGDLLVVCPEPQIRQVFELCDLDRVFDLHLDVEAAVDAALAREMPA